jgi:tRNA A37 threonylcarbamoyladenosine dehydratase
MKMSYVERFGAISRVYGHDAVGIIAKMHVCIVGVGGVGSWAVEALTRTGVGRITLIDNDTISLSNTNRQLHTLTSTLKQSKVKTLAVRMRDINPEIVVNPIDDFLTMETLTQYLTQEYDYVIDAIDSIKFKSAMIAHCKRNKIHLVVTGGAGGMHDPTKIGVADLTKTVNDPLLAKVRSQLRQSYNFSKDPTKRFGVECVFSTEQPVYPKADGTVSHQKPGIHGVSLDCRFGYGSVSYVTSVFGMVAASRVINKTLQRVRKAATR